MTRQWMHRLGFYSPDIRRSAEDAVTNLRAERVGKLLALSVKAGVAYAVTVFTIGFVLGTARVLLVAPRVGSTIAVSVEAPIILTASWYVSKIWMRRLAVGAEIRPRILVGAVAFVTLMILEVALSISVFHRSMGEYLADLRSSAGAIGFAAQICFATFPLLNAVVRRRLHLPGHAPL
jgi:hypothetical protein